MTQLRIDPETVQRMGYEGIVAAERIEADNMLVELCLIAPGHMSSTKYSLAIHWDCDPEKPTAGSSSMEDISESEAEAKAVFGAKVDEIRAELGLPTYAMGPR
ncbi:hypothetical protein ACVIGB_000378 [Bradyrhizobium sp. USDA 4341]